jgi:hypothetical protein
MKAGAALIANMTASDPLLTKRMLSIVGIRCVNSSARAISWIDGCAFASYAAIKALDTARNVSAQCGEMTIEVEGHTRNVGWYSASGGARKTESVNFQRRPLIMPHEITQRMRKDCRSSSFRSMDHCAAGVRSIFGVRTCAIAQQQIVSSRTGRTSSCFWSCWRDLV